MLRFIINSIIAWLYVVARVAYIHDHDKETNHWCNVDGDNLEHLLYIPF